MKNFLSFSLLAGLAALGGIAAPATAHAQSWETTDKLVPLIRWYSPSRGDYFTTSDPNWRGRPGDARSPDYSFNRLEGWVYNPKRSKPAGTVPLYSWWSPSRGDNFVTSDPAWAGAPGSTRDGYNFVRIEGFVKTSASTTTKPLNSWWSSGTADNTATTGWTGSVGDTRPGYVLFRVEGHVFDPSARADLRHYQTVGLPAAGSEPSVIRDQKNRFTCITFSATAALEAAYKKAGFGDLDLSEDALNHFGKMMWLDYSQPSTRPAANMENQVALFGGGGGVGYMQQLRDAKGLRMTEESAAPYRESDAGLPGHPEWYEPWSQLLADDWNLGLLFRQDMVEQEEYFRVKNHAIICGADSGTACSSVATSTYELYLRLGYEIVWDMMVGGNHGGAIWTAPDGTGAHSMLIVGYDRTDPAKPYLIVKNSWGATSGGSGGDCGEGGFTCVSPAYLSTTHGAGVITSVATPSAWDELRFVGRWSLSFDGWKGTLDISRTPGAMQGIFDRAGVGETDRRLGTFFFPDGQAFRVNGEITGNRIRFYLAVDKANLNWGEYAGREFNYYLSGDDLLHMAGYHTDGGGSLFGGYASKTGHVSGTATSGSGAAAWLGTWDVEFDGRRDRLHLGSAYGSAAYGMYYLDGGGAGIAVNATVSGNRATFRVAGVEGRTLDFDLSRLNHQNGVAAGKTTATDGSIVMGVVASRD